MKKEGKERGRKGGNRKREGEGGKAGGFLDSREFSHVQNDSIISL